MSNRPEDFGAVGDGSTDDTEAVQAAIDSKPSDQIIDEGLELVSPPDDSPYADEDFDGVQEDYFDE